MAALSRDIWSHLVASEMEQKNLDMGLVSGPGSDAWIWSWCPVTRMNMISGSVWQLRDGFWWRVLRAEPNVGNHSKGLVPVPGLDLLTIDMGALKTSDFCWLGGAPQVPLPLSASWWVTSVCSWPQSRNSRSSTPPPMRPTWTQQPWRQKGCMCLPHLPV